MHGDSVGKQFRASLKKLVESIDGTHTNYVRCIKPNHDKDPNRFLSGEILRQLSDSGMMETIRIRQQGFGLRLLHAVFLKRYGVLQPAAKTIPELVGTLSAILGVYDRDWQIGKTKVLMRQSLAGQLEQLIAVRLKVSARIIRKAWLRRRAAKRATRLQACWRRRRAQLRLARARAACCRLQAAARRRAADAALQKGIAAAALLQRVARGRRGRAAAEALEQRSHRGKSAEEIVAALAQANKELAEATARHDFARCGELDALCASLAAARDAKISAMPPVARPELEVRILALKLELDAKVAAGDFEACAALTAHVELLEALKRSRPTFAEREEQVAAIRTRIDAAARDKDFAACGVLQRELQEAEQALCDAEWDAEASADHFGDGDGDGDDDDDDPNEQSFAFGDGEEPLRLRQRAPCTTSSSSSTAVVPRSGSKAASSGCGRRWRRRSRRGASTSARPSTRRSRPWRLASPRCRRPRSSWPRCRVCAALRPRPRKLATTAEPPRPCTNCRRSRPCSPPTATGCLRRRRRREAAATGANGKRGGGDEDAAATARPSRPARSWRGDRPRERGHGGGDGRETVRRVRGAAGDDRRAGGPAAAMPTAKEIDAKIAAAKTALAAMAKKDFVTCAAVQEDLDRLSAERAEIEDDDEGERECECECECECERNAAASGGGLEQQRGEPPAVLRVAVRASPTRTPASLVLHQRAAAPAAWRFRRCRYRLRRKVESGPSEKNSSARQPYGGQASAEETRRAGRVECDSRRVQGHGRGAYRLGAADRCRRHAGWHRDDHRHDS